MADEVGTDSVHHAHGSHGVDLVFSNDDIEVWRCDVCSRLEAYCMHTRNSWDDGGTELTCDFCGVDGT